MEREYPPRRRRARKGALAGVRENSRSEIRPRRRRRVARGRSPSREAVARGRAELERRFGTRTPTPNAAAPRHWGNDRGRTNTGITLAPIPQWRGEYRPTFRSLCEAKSQESCGAEVFFSVVLKREEPPPLARFQSRFLSCPPEFARTVGVGSPEREARTPQGPQGAEPWRRRTRFSTHDPTHRR